MENLPKRLCGNCFFFVQQPGDPSTGVCRQSAPTAIPIPVTNPLTGEMKIMVQSMNPPINADYACGQFRQANGERVAAVDDDEPKRIASAREGSRKVN